MTDDEMRLVSDDRTVLAGLCCARLRLRALAGITPRWLAHDSHPSAVVRSFGELHGQILCALEASIELYGRVRLDRVMRLLGPIAGHVDDDGALTGYLPELARKNPRREAVDVALGCVIYRVDEERRGQEGGRALVGALGRALATCSTDARLQVAAVGVADALRRWHG